MKSLIVVLLFPVLLKTCDGQPEQSGVAPLPVPRSTASNSGPGGPGDDPGVTNDAPIDGGIGVLLLAGAAYGVKRYRAGKQKAEK